MRANGVLCRSYLNKKKNQINLDGKVKNVRFISELTKFRICPFAQTFKVPFVTVASHP
eukprot:COSAG05_NODE_3504_length_2024_cov_1.375065_4_plen_58_part_00